MSSNKFLVIKIDPGDELVVGRESNSLLSEFAPSINIFELISYANLTYSHPIICCCATIEESFQDILILFINGSPFSQDGMPDIVIE